MLDRWRLAEIPDAELAQVLPLAGGDPLVARLMWLRQIRTPEQARRFFDARIRQLSSPFLIAGVFRAVDRLMRAVADEEPIRVYGDRDVDGITSTIVMLETLRSLTPRVDFCIPLIEDGYGLNPEQLQNARRDGIRLLVTVDCGISNVDEVRLASEYGIDVIITDHHEPPPVLPAALAIVDPKLPNNGDGDGPGPSDQLAGVGVSVKLALALALASSPRLAQPLIAVDYTGTDIELLRFSPREGFSPVRLNPGLLEQHPVLFASAAEAREIAQLVPELGTVRQPVYLDLLRREFDPQLPTEKPDLGRELGVPPAIAGARRLVLCYLKLIETSEPSVRQLWQRSLDVLTLGTIADMVPLRDENRVIAKVGLPFIGRTRRLGLLELFARLGWNQRTITEKEVSWNIAPILNASGRLKTAELAIDLLTTDHPPLAESLSRELVELNQERRRLVTSCYAQILPHVHEQCDLERDRLLLVQAPVPNQGVTGIVATRLVQDFHRPVIVLVNDGDYLLGSARSFNQINLVEVLHACGDLLVKYGGHISAAGLTVRPENLAALRQRLREVTAELIPPEALSDIRTLDAALAPGDLTDHLLDTVGRFAPFGTENPAPRFIVHALPVTEVRRVGEHGAHLRFRFRRPDGSTVSGIGFNLGERITNPETIAPNRCDAVCTIEANTYNGTRQLQLVIQDLHVHQPVAAPAGTAAPCRPGGGFASENAAGSTADARDPIEPVVLTEASEP